MDSASSIYGCYNRADFKNTIEVQDGWHHRLFEYQDGSDDRVCRMVVIKDTSTKPCVYTLTHQSDPHCIGCSRHAYNVQVTP